MRSIKYMYKPFLNDVHAAIGFLNVLIFDAQSQTHSHAQGECIQYVDCILDFMITFKTHGFHIKINFYQQCQLPTSISMLPLSLLQPNNKKNVKMNNFQVMVELNQLDCCDGDTLLGVDSICQVPQVFHLQRKPLQDYKRIMCLLDIMYIFSKFQTENF